MLRSTRPLLARSPLAAALAPLVLGLSLEARAAWEAVPEVTLGVDSNDNSRLEDEGSADTTSRTFLDAGIGLTSFNERSTFTFAPRIVTDAYADSDDSDLEADDFYLYGSGRRNWQSVGLGFRADYANESILRAELDDATPDIPDDEEPDAGGTGRLVIFNEDREQAFLRGDMDLRISERNALNLQLQQRSIDYSGGTQTALLSGRSDYDENRVSLGLTRRVDERNSVSARVFVSSYDAQLNDNQTDSVGVEGRFQRPISRTWGFNLSAGVQRSDYDFLDLNTQQRVDNADTNYTLGAGLRKRNERGNVTLNVAHAVNPSAYGFLVVRDEARAVVQRQLRPRLGMEVGARVSRSRTLDDVDRNNDRSYSRVEIGFEWAMSRTLYLEAGYDFVRQEFTNENSEDSTSNTIFFGITYRGMSRQQP